MTTCMHALVACYDARLLVVLAFVSLLMYKELVSSSFSLVAYVDSVSVSFPVSISVAVAANTIVVVPAFAGS